MSTTSTVVQQATNCDNVTFQVGDVVTAYTQGVWRIAAIEALTTHYTAAGVPSQTRYTAHLVKVFHDNLETPNRVQRADCSLDWCAHYGRANLEEMVKEAFERFDNFIAEDIKKYFPKRLK